MNHARIAQEAADGTFRLHYTLEFSSGYGTVSTDPNPWINLMAKSGPIQIDTAIPKGWSYELAVLDKQMDEPEPEPYVEPAPQWQKAAIYAFGAIWCLAVWFAVFYAAYRIF